MSNDFVRARIGRGKKVHLVRRDLPRFALCDQRMPRARVDENAEGPPCEVCRAVAGSVDIEVVFGSIPGNRGSGG